MKKGKAKVRTVVVMVLMAAADEVQSATGGRRPDIQVEGGWFQLPADVQTCIADGKSRIQKPLVMEGVMEGRVLGWWLMGYSPGCAVVRLERKEGKRKQRRARRGFLFFA